MYQGYFSDQLTTPWLELVQGQARYAALHFEAPSTGDPGASEVTSPGYARAEMSWSFVDGRTLSSGSLTFGPIASQELAAVGLWDAPVGGRLLIWGMPDPGYPIVVGDTGLVVIRAGDLLVAF